MVQARLPVVRQHKKDSTMNCLSTSCLALSIIVSFHCSKKNDSDNSGNTAILADTNKTSLNNESVISKPTIVRDPRTVTVVLPPSMKEVLSHYDSTFRIWKYDDYTERIKELDLIDTSDNHSPFALIVDANGDGIADVILAGRNDTSEQILCILSEGKGYAVMKIEDHGILPDPKTEEHYDEGKKEYGLNTCLGLFRFEKSARNPVFEVKIPQESDSNGNLLNDGAIITYYFENGTFVRESEVL